MAKKKLTATERSVDKEMLSMLNWAYEYPKPGAWHKIGNLDATKKGAELLAKRGVIDVSPKTNMYRLKPT